MNNGRINERNTGDWSIDSEPKKRTKIFTASIKLTQSEIDLMKYILRQVAKCVKLSEIDGKQFFTDNSDFICQFERERIEDLWSIQNKLSK